MTEAEVQRLMGLACRAADPPQSFAYWRLEAAPAALESALRELLPAGWISVEERLPEPGVRALAWCDSWGANSDQPFLAHYGKPMGWEDTRRGRMVPGVTHWMPAPAAPSATTAPAAPEAPSLRAAAEKALHEMCNTSAPRESFTDAVDALAAALSAEVPADARGALAAFGAWAAKEFRDSLADVGGGSAQDAMERFGVIVKRTVTEPCGEGCICLEYGEFPHECFVFPDAVSAAIGAMAAPTPQEQKP